MSKSIENAMYYSWMSQASYLDLTNVGNTQNGQLIDLRASLVDNAYADDKIFAAGQAETFVNL